MAASREAVLVGTVDVAILLDRRPLRHIRKIPYFLY